MDNKFALKLRALFQRLHLCKTNEGISPRNILEKEQANSLIYEKLMSGQPCMIARYGANELGIAVNYLGVREKKHSYLSYARGTTPAWWWNENLRYAISNNAGFFPATDEWLEKFAQLMISDSKYADILGTSQPEETYMECFLKDDVRYMRLSDFEPFWSPNPWSRALEGKRVLVVYPLADSIKEQYKKRELLFSNKNVLPKFASLQAIKSIQSLGCAHQGFATWFDALRYMENEISKAQFDVCLIGCGAYGFPLAAFVKRMGKQAIQMGGSLQLLFGITGSRWDQPIKENGRILDFTSLVNEHWIRPSASDKPANYRQVENSCYW